MSAAPAPAAPLRIEPLDTLSSMPFRSMTFPSYQRLLDGASRAGPHLALGARDGDRPVGLALGEMLPGPAPECRVLSLFAASTDRNRGVGTHLLAALVAAFERLGGARARISFVSGKPSGEALRRVLEKCGWPPPRPSKWLGQGVIAKAVHLPFISRYRLPAEIEVIPWGTLTGAERDAIERACGEGGWVPPSLAPMPYEVCIEPRTSTALRHRGEILGWMITQAIRPGLLTYSCSYMHPRWQRRGRILGLYVETARRHHALMSEYPRGTLVVPYEFPAMVAFAKRRFAPVLDTVTEFERSVLALRGGA